MARIFKETEWQDVDWMNLSQDNKPVALVNMLVKLKSYTECRECD